MTTDIKLLYGIADLTKNWNERKEQFFKFACNSKDTRWKQDEFVNHMKMNYIDVEMPITLQIYNLDDKNIKTLKAFIEWYY